MARIKLYSEMSSNLITRNSLKAVFSKINKIKEKKIIVDFENIEFVSRSCADEYLKQKAKSDKKIAEVNQSSDIKKMFEFVKNAEIPQLSNYKRPDAIAVTVI